MARMLTHRVVGEIVYARLDHQFRPHLGPFLLGNVLADLHRFKMADRATADIGLTHLVHRYCTYHAREHPKPLKRTLHR